VLDRVSCLRRERHGLRDRRLARAAERNDDRARCAGLALVDVRGERLAAQVRERQLERQLLALQRAGERAGRRRSDALRLRDLTRGGELRRQLERAFLADGREAACRERRRQREDGERDECLLQPLLLASRGLRGYSERSRVRFAKGALAADTAPSSRQPRRERPREEKTPPSEIGRASCRERGEDEDVGRPGTR